MAGPDLSPCQSLLRYSHNFGTQLLSNLLNLVFNAFGHELFVPVPTVWLVFNAQARAWRPSLPHDLLPFPVETRSHTLSGGNSVPVTSPVVFCSHFRYFIFGLRGH